MWFLVFLILVVPYGFYFTHGGISHWGSVIQEPATWNALGFTICQAALSSLLACVIGLALAPGYAHFGSKRRLLAAIWFLPSLLSPILICLGLLLSFRTFPFGWTGILLGHILMNATWCGVVLGEAWHRQESRFAMVENQIGLKGIGLLWRVRLPLMGKDLIGCAVTVFALCLTSFAVPLTLGGGPQFSTLEVLIYEWIRVYGDWEAAAALGALNSMFQVLVFIMVLKPFLQKDDYRKELHQDFQWDIWSAIALVGTLLMLYPLAEIGATGVGGLKLLTHAEWFEFLKSGGISLALAISVGVLIGGLVLLAHLISAPWWLRYWPLQSGVSMGVSLFLLLQEWPGLQWFALGLGQMALFFPLLWRQLEPQVRYLRGQWADVIKVNGLSRLKQIKIWLGVSRGPLMTASTLATCWSLGEFSLAKTFSVENPTVTLLIHQHLGSYRLEQASALALMMMVVVFVLVGTSWRVPRGEN